MAMIRYLAVKVAPRGPNPVALFKDHGVGRQWAVDHYPGVFVTEIVEREDLTPVVAVVAPIPVIEPVFVPPETILPKEESNWSGDPDYKDDDAAVVPAQVKRVQARRRAKSNE